MGVRSLGGSMKRIGTNICNDDLNIVHTILEDMDPSLTIRIGSNCRRLIDTLVWGVAQTARERIRR